MSGGTSFRGWRDEIEQTAAEMFAAELRPPRIVLTDTGALDNRLLPGMTRDELAAEIEQGIHDVSHVRDDGDSHVYKITTEKLALWVRDEASRADPWSRLIILTGVKERRKEWRKPAPPIRPSVVEFADHWELQSFDVAALVEEMRRRRDLVEAVDGLTKVRITPRRQTALRAAARRRYGSLRALLELAKDRADNSVARSSAGIVVPSNTVSNLPLPEGTLVVRLSGSPSFSEQEGTRFTVTLSGDMESASDFFLSAQHDDLIVLAPARRVRPGADFAPNDIVQVVEPERFRYHRQRQALRDFLDENVVGSWTNLATLLCQSENLLHRPRRLEPRSGALPLNLEQRNALAGALHSPHAYFIQGPPGTGKSHVITELISRLTARGERVLLTAPTHVAVDEVLERIGAANEPGVLPIRISYSDTQVAEHALRFTPAAYRGMIADDVRIPATSAIKDWEATLAQVGGDHVALVDWQRALEDHLSAARQAAMLSDRVNADVARAEAQSATLAREANMLAHHDEYATRDADAAASHIDQLAAQIESLAATRSVFGRLADWLGFGALAQTVQAHEQATTYWRSAEQQRVFASGRLAEHRARAARTDAAAHEHLTHVRRQFADARERLAAAIGQRDAARASLDSRGLAKIADQPDALDARIAATRRERETLSARIAVQREWFTLCGTDGTDERADRAQATSAVSRALWPAANLVCSTTTGFGGSKDFNGLDYDTLIVDEASKVTAAEFLIPAVRARRWVLVGDEKQLPPYVESQDEHHIHALAALAMTERLPELSADGAVRQLGALWHEREDAELHPFRIESVQREATRMLESGHWQRTYRTTFLDQISHIDADGDQERSLLRAMDDHLVRSLFETDVAKIDTSLRARLLEQWRMPAQLAEVVRIPVYGGEYTSPPGERRPLPLLGPSFQTPILFLDTSAQPQPWDRQTGTSFENPLEADWVAAVCEQWNRELAVLDIQGRTSISVLSFYGAQAKLLRQRLGAPSYPKFDRLHFKLVDSIDRIQGQQSDIVIISFCRTYGRPKDPTRRFVSNSRPSPGYARWLQNLNRLNVACTRARRALVLVGHGTTLRGLNGVPQAELFYENLFKLPTNVLTVRKEWLAGGTYR